ncbi:hypothetical protein JCGZ_01684 [Jatropha curcas]|uniref:Aminotransferase-like plant mobile domain-containing protein n=1 Tax=Jatropha curcas TaxID=180498 RepID=A0A067JGG6_JATCU|nr:hypothetical protein JCGZ_01684 [Jatropha curcas]
MTSVATRGVRHFSAVWLDCSLVVCCCLHRFSVGYAMKGLRHGKSGGNTFTTGEWFDRLPKRAYEHQVIHMLNLFGFEGRLNARTLPRGRAWHYSMRYSHKTSNTGLFRQLLNGLNWDRTQLLVYVPPPTEFDPFAKEEELDRGQGIAPVQVSIDDYNEVCQLYEVARLKLAVVRLSDEHASIKLSIISRRIPMVDEIPAVPQLDIEPASFILPVFGFSVYEIPSYDFGADVVPLRLLVQCAMSMDRTSLYWPSLVCFCIISQYLLLNGIDDYGSLRLVPIVEHMARRRTPFPLILAKTFIWLGDHAQPS